MLTRYYRSLKSTISKLATFPANRSPLTREGDSVWFSLNQIQMFPSPTSVSSWYTMALQNPTTASQSI